MWKKGRRIVYQPLPEVEKKKRGASAIIASPTNAQIRRRKDSPGIPSIRKEDRITVRPSDPGSQKKEGKRGRAAQISLQFREISGKKRNATSTACDPEIAGGGEKRREERRSQRDMPSTAYTLGSEV